MIRQLTTTVYIVQADRTLLMWHQKLQKWQPPGGHLEADELPHEAAIREVLEETGMLVDLWDIDQLEPILPIDQPNAQSIPRPYRLMLQHLPAHQDQPTHQHLDFSFVARPISPIPEPRIGEAILNQEGHEVRWFSLQQLLLLDPGREIFVDTLQTLHSIFNHPNHNS